MLQRSVTLWQEQIGERTTDASSRGWNCFIKDKGVCTARTRQVQEEDKKGPAEKGRGEVPGQNQLGTRKERIQPDLSALQWVGIQDSSGLGRCLSGPGSHNY